MSVTDKTWPLIVANNYDDSSDKTKDCVLELYKEYLASAAEWDKASTAAEKFYSTINMAVLSGYVLIIKEDIHLTKITTIAFLIAAIWFSVMWVLTNFSYARAVSVKMEVAQEIEELLPLRPFKYEWEEKFRKSRYIRISRVQRVFPVIFILLYLILGVDLILK